MTRKEAVKGINRIQNQLDALDYFIAISRIPAVKKYLSVEFDVTYRERVAKAIESLKNDLVLTIVACKKDTL